MAYGSRYSRCLFHACTYIDFHFAVADKSDTSDTKIEATFLNGMDDIVRMHITKCGVSGPPNTGKSHVRALMLRLKRPSKRASTALADDADIIIDAEDMVELSKTGWKMIKHDKEYMTRRIANTIYDKMSKKPASNPEFQAHCASPRSSARREYKANKAIKTHLKRLRKTGKKLNRKCLNGIHLVYFVDTGGQPQFQEILPHFIRCDVHLLVYNMSQKLEDCPPFNYISKGEEYSVPEQLTSSNIGIIEQSVRSITSSITSAERKPHVAIIGTFKDQCNSGSTEYKKMLKERSQQIRRTLEPYAGIGAGKCDVFSFQRDETIYPIDGSERGWDSNEYTLFSLKSRIHDCSDSREVEVPIKYLVFYQNLLQYAEESFVSLEECEKVASNSNIGMSKSDVIEALVFFSNCNLILYFPKILQDLAFIKPSFLFHMVTDLIVASFHCKSDGDSISYSRDEFQKTGVFNHEILASIKLPKETFTIVEFLKLLKGLYIIAKVENGFFMPCVLPLLESSSTELQQYENSMTRLGFNGPYIISFANGMSPRGLFCSLLVALAADGMWKLKNLLQSNFRRRNLVEFDYYKFGSDNCVGTIVVVDQNSRLEFYSTCAKQHCISIREAVHAAFISACKSLDYNYEGLYSYGFVCRANCEHSYRHSSEVFKDESKGQWKERCSIRKGNRVQLPEDRAIWFESGES